MGNINVICQYCGVGLEIEDDVTSFDCPNCGARLHTDFQALEDTEIYYQDRVARNRSVQSRKKGYGGFVAIILVAILFAGVGFYIWGVPSTPSAPIAVRWPVSFDEAKKMSFNELSSRLKKEKFTNVEGESTPIPRVHLSKIEVGQIKGIVVYELGRTYQDNKIKKDQVFSSDVKIVITYYK